MTWGSINIWLYMEKVWRVDGNLLFLGSFFDSQNFHSSILTYTNSHPTTGIGYKKYTNGNLVSLGVTATGLKEQLSVLLGNPTVFSSHRVVGYVSQMMSLLLPEWMINWNLRMAGLAKHDHWYVLSSFPPQEWQGDDILKRKKGSTHPTALLPKGE